jgi:NADPH-dependent ferric siderophore reductase
VARPARGAPQPDADVHGAGGRPAARELDVDVVLHGATGPASAWAERAAVGDEVVLVGPNARFDRPRGGVEWQPPADPSCLLLAGDETAVPAICAITESLPPGTRARVLLEVPTAADILPLSVPAGLELTWLPRRTGETATPAPHGSRLAEAVVHAVPELPARPCQPQEKVDDDAAVLWEVPSAAPAPYVWLAGESGTVRALRRHLVQHAVLDRGSIAFMGYWRAGTSGG